jgi:hypothetical protein
VAPPVRPSAVKLGYALSLKLGPGADQLKPVVSVELHAKIGFGQV